MAQLVQLPMLELELELEAKVMAKAILLLPSLILILIQIRLHSPPRQAFSKILAHLLLFVYVQQRA